MVTPSPSHQSASSLQGAWSPWVRRLRGANPYVFDGALAALVLAAASVQFLFPEKDDDSPVTWAGWLLVLGTALPLAWRRRAPYAVTWAVTVCTVAMALHHAPPPDVSYGGLVALYTLAALGRPWQRRSMVAGWLAGASLTLWHMEHAETFEYAFHLLTIASAYGLGVLARLQRAYTSALEDRARRLERERESERARAAAEERARIARDMHDILAHAVSLMVVQAEAGPVALQHDRARAEAAFDAIASSGRDAMGQLRRILGVLKGEEVSVQPQPTVAGLPELVRQVRRAGLRVELRSEGEVRALDPDAEVAVYRVVQEALTNTLKHAGASAVEVRLDWGDGELVVTVVDDGAGAPGRQPGAGGGQGLVGIRERATACGGSAAAGPGPDGRGFQVTARLPVPSNGTAGALGAPGAPVVGRG
ncbi:histidine kinase [Streptomyces sp. NPDC051940]|uniref:sensor histidine kinase n=1 Tax=Streptomyces sp. NPDC051940 TaxID=3155675 RepID=UPI0034127D40